MKVRVGRAIGEHGTPAEARKVQYVTMITDLMAYNGLKSVSYRTAKMGVGMKLIVSSESFDDAPVGIRIQSLVVKDAIAALMSVANLSHVEISLDDEEYAAVREGWREDIENAAKIGPDGKTQDESAHGGPSGSEVEIDLPKVADKPPKRRKSRKSK